MVIQSVTLICRIFLIWVIQNKDLASLRVSQKKDLTRFRDSPTSIGVFLDLGALICYSQSAKFWYLTTCHVAYAVLSVRKGKVKEPSRILPFLPDFASFFPIFPSFSRFLAFFFAGGGTLPSLTPSGYTTVDNSYRIYMKFVIKIPLLKCANGDSTNLVLSVWDKNSRYGRAYNIKNTCIIKTKLYKTKKSFSTNTK